MVLGPGCRSWLGPPAPQRLSLLKNGDFARGSEGWQVIGEATNPYHPEDTGRASFEFRDQTLRIGIADPGQSIWSVMLCQSVRFEKGRTYSVSFTAMADRKTTMVSNIVQDGTWINYSGDRTFALGPRLQTYSYTFTAPDNLTALFQMCFGHQTQTSIYIASLRLSGDSPSIP